MPCTTVLSKLCRLLKAEHKVTSTEKLPTHRNYSLQQACDHDRLLSRTSHVVSYVLQEVLLSMQFATQPERYLGNHRLTQDFVGNLHLNYAPTSNSSPHKRS